MKNATAAPRNVAQPAKRRGSMPNRGVRKRKCGRFAVEKKRLGTYSTAEEAAVVYDRAARRFGSPQSKCNFPIGGGPTEVAHPVTEANPVESDSESVCGTHIAEDTQPPTEVLGSKDGYILISKLEVVLPPITPN
ncbi:hypothetical protein ACS0TY_013008 [Phlomoides rotata]